MAIYSFHFHRCTSVIVPYQQGKSNNSLEWSPLAFQIITNSYDAIVVLNKFRSTLTPTSWSGSRSEIMQNRLCLISELKNHKNSYIKDWADNEELVFEEEIRLQRECELNIITFAKRAYGIIKRLNIYKAVNL